MPDIRPLTAAFTCLLLASCATVAPVPKAVEAPVAAAQLQVAQQAIMQPAQKTLKRKIAIGRFSNETRYGKSFLRDGDQDPLGKQASDKMATALVSSGQFLVFERPDLNKLEREQAISGQARLVGVEALILGSITEFGRQTVGKTGFLSETKMQVARAKVEIRLVDPKTGFIIFSGTGTGEANTETGSVAGYGSTAAYDETLNDRAIAAAISDVQNTLINKLQEKPWTSDILSVDGNQVIISGGARQGLQAGDTLTLYRRGKTIKSAQTGFDITLPPERIGALKIESFFGDNETNEGSVTRLVDGRITGDTQTLFVGEERK
jgi:curli biogenesis system outer membrane secretion channel CsgG